MTSSLQGVIMLILATDMARHSEILDQFKKYVKNGFEISNEEHLNYVSIFISIFFILVGSVINLTFY